MRPSRSLALLAALLPAVLAAPSTLSAQVAVLDEGTFTLLRDGRRVGREDFSIRTTAGAAELAVLAAQGTVTIEDRRLTPALSANANGVPVSYQLEERIGRETEGRWALQLSGGRAAVRRRDRRGEASGEFLAPGAPILVDDEVVHHLWFVVRRTRDGAVPIIVPRRNIVLTLRVHAAGSESITIAGRPVEATHLVLTPAAGPEPTRDVWVDAAGRLLKVVVPAQNLTAVRDDPPRPTP